jgi:uncharacterized protein YbbK (DUF523 family)/uncharacterized protein YbgA (DUF1722 family)
MSPDPLHARPRLVLSRCLELDACRYNGVAVPTPLVRRLEPHVELLPICPEVEIGLGVPRDPIRLVRRGSATALLQPATGRDLTEPMRSFSTGFLSALPEVEGFLLKARSPSCGIHGVKVFGDAASEEPQAREAGMFAAAVLAAFPEHPIEHEARLGNPRLRDEFLTRLFALAALRAAREDGTPDALTALHHRYETTLEVHGGEAEARALGRITKGSPKERPSDAWARYRAGFRRVLAQPARPGAHAAALARIRGELEGEARAGERALVDGLVEEYRRGGALRGPLLAALRGWAARAGTARFQGYLNPYPQDLREES